MKRLLVTFGIVGAVLAWGMVAPGTAFAAQENGLEIGGALRVNYAYLNFDDHSESKEGDLTFELFRIDANHSYESLLLSAQYRWYGYMDVVHHAWIGYEFADTLQAQLGVTQVPFGLLPYASHNWWFGLPFYVGLEDDYDMGLKLIASKSPWEVQLAFFKNGEWGSASKTERYSIDIVRALEEENEEANQLNARLAYRIEGGKLAGSEIGVSGQVGELYNATTDECGSHWAAAAHLNGKCGPFGLMLEAARYEYDPENPPGVDDTTVVMGGYADAYRVAAKGNAYQVNLSYELPVQWGPVSMLTFYNDYGILDKDEQSFQDSQSDTIGCMLSAGDLYVLIDVIMGKNMVWLGGGDDPMASGEDDAEWHTRFNVNFGYYF